MAGGAKGGDDEGIITDINVTPLVDVVLVLLIILMVTATAIVRNNTIPVELPEATDAEEAPPTTPTTLAVSIDDEGQIYLEAEALSLGALEDRARRARAQDDETRAILNADGRITHARVVAVIDALRRADVTKFAINVRPSDLEAGRQATP